MKVLLEVSSESSEYHSQRFEWLRDSSNRLFLIEAGKRLRTISILKEPGKVLESANLADGRVCTNFSWNKDGNQLAMVVDKRLIYFWDVRDNNLVHYKPALKALSEVDTPVTSSRAKDVEHIVWSKVTNRIVIGFSTGQLLLCNCESSLKEKLIDNGQGVLREISNIVSSPHSDVFACTTAIFELLVMTYDGQVIFYNQGSEYAMRNIKFSPSIVPKSHSNSYALNRGISQSFWLAHSADNNKIYFRLIGLKEHQTTEESPSDELVHILDEDERLIHYDWVDPSNLVICLASGVISLIQVGNSSQKSGKFYLTKIKLLEIGTSNLIDDDINSLETTKDRDCFKSFKLMNDDKFVKSSVNVAEWEDSNASSRYGRSFSFAAMTMYKLFYYELVDTNDSSRYTFEKIDELDLTTSLRKIGLQLEQLEWSFDSSMLAVKLTNGHVLIYQTRLKDYLVTSYGPRTAYLSESNEITLLNYGLGDVSDESELSKLRHSPTETSSLELASKASIIKVDLKPSVIAIGLRHLAVGLNNLVRFYSTQDGEFLFQEEYNSIVSSICLCVKYVSVQFNDGRVKLHPLKEAADLASDDQSVNERFFPDPTKSEKISAYILTDDTFIYCTSVFDLHVFCLHKWNHSQILNHYKTSEGQIIRKLVPDGRGNKYLCLVEPLPQIKCRVFLYDSYRNEMTSLCEENRLYAKIFQSQLALVPSLSQSKIESVQARAAARQKPDLSRIYDAIWDSDGKSILLIERKLIHLFIVLDHTLEREGPISEWVTTIGKQSTYATLYASHGVISFQTSLGRVINSICESHDDEAKLNKLSQEIQSMVASRDTPDKLDIQTGIMRLKLEYLQTIMLIYPLSKCAEICEYIMSDSQFNVCEEDRSVEIDDVLWRQLAARALFTSNVQFAMLVYERRRLHVFARGLSDIIDDFTRLGFDSKSSVTTRLLILLGCDCDDE